MTKSCHNRANHLLHHGPVTLHVGVDRDAHATHELLVLGRIILVGLAVLLGELLADLDQLSVYWLEPELFSKDEVLSFRIYRKFPVYAKRQDIVFSILAVVLAGSIFAGKDSRLIRSSTCIKDRQYALP